MLVFVEPRFILVALCGATVKALVFALLALIALGCQS